MGFASFHTPEQAFEALKRFNGIYFQRRMLRLRPSRLFGRRGRLEHGAGLGPSSSGAPRTSPTKTLYIGNLDWEVTPKQFKDAVVAAAAEAGETSRSKNSGGIIGVRLAVDRDTGWPRGFAHVEFNSFEAAQAAFPKFREFVFNGRAVVVDYALPGRQRGGSGTANSKAESEPARPAEKVKAVGGDQTDGQDNGNAEKKAEGPKADGEVELKGVAKA